MLSAWDVGIRSHPPSGRAIIIIVISPWVTNEDAAGWEGLLVRPQQLAGMPAQDLLPAHLLVLQELLMIALVLIDENLLTA